MKKTRSVSVVSFVVTLLVVVFSAPGWAQTTTTVSPLAPGGGQTFTQINPPPCDFSDTFYGRNGIDVNQLNQFGQRFGNSSNGRQFGPPATSPNQANWMADPNCNINDPTRRNFRILATTGAFRDDNGAPTEFFSIIAFVTNQNFFLPAPVGFTPPDTSGNARNINMIDIVSNFEAYAATKQVLPNGHIASTPCGSLQDPTDPNLPDCFSLGVNAQGLISVATPNLRQDWRITSNRNAMDGSDNNCINTQIDPSTGKPVCNVNGVAQVHNSPFGYFCDDLLGMWIVTYFWYNANSVGAHVPATVINPNTGQRIPNPCPAVLNALRNRNGTSLDGTPIIKTGDELHFIEGVPSAPPVGGVSPPVVPCGAEGNIAQDGSDHGAVWLVCPDLQDPRNGAIAKDAFLDVVRLANGNAQNKDLLNNFSCLQNVGKFCNEAAPGN